MILCRCLDLHPHPHQNCAPACVSQRLRATLGERCRHITIINAGGDAGRDKDSEGVEEEEGEEGGWGREGGRQEPGVERRLVKKTMSVFLSAHSRHLRLRQEGEKNFSTGAADRLRACACAWLQYTRTLRLSLRCTRVYLRCSGGLAGAWRWRRRCSHVGFLLLHLPAAAAAAAETAAAPPLLSATPACWPRGPGSGFNKEEAGKNNPSFPPPPPPPPRSP